MNMANIIAHLQCISLHYLIALLVRDSLNQQYSIVYVRKYIYE